MISPFFYLQKQKATEEERIAFYQERMAEVKDWLIHDFVREKYIGFSTNCLISCRKKRLPTARVWYTSDGIYRDCSTQ